MLTHNDLPWAGVFCGREPELGMLMQAWDRVAEQKGPELIVILGESGLGKTRLVQEFFGRLSTRIDGAGIDGYWPDQLTREVNNLRINPEPAACRISNRDKMGFLWWGIRLTDPVRRNASLGGLSEAIEFLQPHMESFARARILNARKKELGKTVASDFAIELGNLFTFGLLGISKNTFNYLHTWREIAKDARSIERFDLGSTQQEKQDTLVDLTLSDLSALFIADNRKGVPLPAVILLDDAQWLQGDDTTREFIARLLRRARTESWPLLLVATHWEKEWHDDYESDSHSCFAAIAREFCSSAWNPIKLGREPNLASMIARGFPGVTSTQTELILQKADGNPRLLDEILHHLMRSKGLFKSGDRTASLTLKGEKALRAKAFNLHKLVAERLADAPEAVRAAVGLSGIQGLRFLAGVTAKVANALGVEAIADGLSDAERPYAMIARLEDGLAEFAQRVYLEVALEQLPDLMDEVHARQTLRKALLGLAGPQADFEELTPHEREAAWLIGTDLFLDKDGADEDVAAEVAAWCFLQAVMAESGRHAFMSAGSLAKRFAAAMETGAITPGSLRLENLLWIGDASWNASDFQTADYLYRTCLKRARSQVGMSQEGLKELIWCLSRVGDIECTVRGPRAALCFYEEALALSRDPHETVELQRELAFSLEQCAGARAQLRQPKASLPLYEDALAIRRDIVESASTRAARRELTQCLLKSAVAQWMVYGPASALPYAQQALNVTRRLRGELDTPEAKRDLAYSLRRLGQVQAHVNGPYAGIAYYEEALTINRLLAETLYTPQAKQDLSVNLCLIGALHAQLSGAEAALPLFKEAVDITRFLVKEIDALEAVRIHGINLSRLGDATAEIDGAGQALPMYEESLKIAEAAFSTNPTLQSRSDLIYACIKVGDMLVRTSGPAAALHIYEKALDHSQALTKELRTPLTLRKYAYSLIRVAHMQHLGKDSEAALSSYKKALRFCREVAGSTDLPLALRDISYSLLKVGEILKRITGPNAAVPLYTEAVALNRTTVGKHDTQRMQYNLAISLIKLGEAEAETGDLDDAFSRYEEADRIFRTLIEEMGTPNARRGLSIKSKSAGSILSQISGPQSAIPLYEEALSVSNFLSGSIERKLASDGLACLLIRKGDAKAQMRNFDAAINLYEEALSTICNFCESLSEKDQVLVTIVESSIAAIKRKKH
jgi:tetratricopeptide (TPR) repeat protein